MKIIKQSFSELVLKSRPDVVGKYLAAIFIIFPPMIIFPIFHQISITTLLKCKRVEPTQVSCEKQESSFFGLVEQPPIRFSQVKSAKFTTEEGIDSEGDVDSVAERYIDNWVTLVTSSGEVTAVKDFVYVNGVRGSASEMLLIVTQINNFIQSNQPSLQIQRGSFGLSLLLLGFLLSFPLAGIHLFLISSRCEIIVFDKNNHRLIREQKSLLGKKYRYYSLDEIKEVDIETKTDSDNDTFYYLQLLPKSTHKRILMWSRSLPEVENIQIAIRDFLGIPLPKTFPYFFLRAVFLEKLLGEENATTVLFAVCYAVSIKRLP